MKSGKGATTRAPVGANKSLSVGRTDRPTEIDRGGGDIEG